MTPAIIGHRAEPGQVDDDVGGDLDLLRQHPPDPLERFRARRPGQLEVRRDGRQVTQVVAGRHGQAALDQRLPQVGEQVAFGRVRSPGHCVYRCRPACRPSAGTLSLSEERGRAPPGPRPRPRGRSGAPVPPKLAKVPHRTAARPPRATQRPTGSVQCMGWRPRKRGRTRRPGRALRTQPARSVTRSRHVPAQLTEHGRRRDRSR